jgi:hypothetical protein
MMAKKRKRGPTKPIHISKDDGTAEDQKLSKGLLEQARWVSDTGNRSIIVFNGAKGSPFEETEFRVPAGGEVISGPLKSSVKKNDQFKYTIVGTKGTTDPIIIIDN